MPAKSRVTKPSKKTTRKVSKKATKKVAKKTAKKVAKKVAKKAPARPQRARQNKAAVPAEARRDMIEKAAYYRAERRSFRNGDPVADWLSSEREVDELLNTS